MFIPTGENTADCATRGITAKELIDHSWWKGPKLLRQSKQYWSNTVFYPDPQGDDKASLNKSREEDDPINDQEQGDHPTVNKPVNVSLSRTKDHSTKFPTIQLSTWFKTKRAMALILKFIKRVLFCNISKENQTKLLASLPELAQISVDPMSEISTDDTLAAEKCLIKPAHTTRQHNAVRNQNHIQRSHSTMQ